METNRGNGREHRGDDEYGEDLNPYHDVPPVLLFCRSQAHDQSQCIETERLTRPPNSRSCGAGYTPWQPGRAKGCRRLAQEQIRGTVVEPAEFGDSRSMSTRPGLKIGRILGIPIYLHATWVFIFAGITYIIAQQFKQAHPLWTTSQHWIVGVLTILVFFSSVVFHELSHSVVAQHYKIRVLSITLFLFGGLARIERDPSKAIQEFNIAIAGPLASGFLAVGFFGLTRLFPYSQMMGALATWLWQTNAALAVFNLLPGFPLDGGRIFRAVVWGATKNFEKATRVAGASGKMIAYAMILFGAWRVVHGEVQMLWTVSIGWFILNAAQESVAQVAIRESLAG